MEPLPPRRDLRTPIRQPHVAPQSTDMPASVVALCPTCQSSLENGAVICARCRTVLHDDYLATAVPLLLPGTPGLSPDPVAQARSARLVRLVAWSVLVTSVGATIGFAVAGESRVEPSREVRVAAPVVEPQSFTDSIAPLVLAPTRVAVAAVPDSVSTLARVVADSASARNRVRVVTPRVAEVAVIPRRARIAVDTVPIATVTAAAPVAQRPVTPPPIVQAPVVRESVSRPIVVAERAAAAAAPPSPSPSAPPIVNDSPLALRPDAGDVRTAVDRFVGALRSVSRTSFDLGEFFGDGEEHRVTLVRAPATLRETLRSVRVSFELRLSKVDAAGRRFTRLLPVSLDVTRSDGAVSTSAVEFGSLRKP